MIVVSDTSPITHLAAIHCLDLLQQLYSNIVIPPAVYRELVEAGDLIPGAIEVQTLDWIQVQPAANLDQVNLLLQDLDPGESEAIVLATELNARLLLMDERRGRAIAVQLGLNVTGVLGVLLAAKSRGLINAVKPLVDELLTTGGFWIRPSLYAEVIRLAGE